MDYFKELSNQPAQKPLPNPKGFKMPNKFYKKGSMEEKIMMARYNKLNNKPRFINERRHIESTDIINENGRW